MALKNRCGIYHYRHNSYIVRGTATSPLGPFEYDGVALDNRTAPLFDAVEVEDPNLVALPGGAGYLLFYAGSAFPSPLPPGNHTAHLNCTASDVHYGKHDPRCNWGDECRSFSMAAPFLRT